MNRRLDILRYPNGAPIPLTADSAYPDMRVIQLHYGKAGAILGNAGAAGTIVSLGRTRAEVAFDREHFTRRVGYEMLYELVGDD